MDYPQFRLTCRASVNVVRREDWAELLGLQLDLYWFATLVRQGDFVQLLNEGARFVDCVKYDTIAAAEREELALHLTLDAIAYALLRRTDSNHNVPLRRAQLHRFWSSRNSEVVKRSGPAETPQSLAQLREVVDSNAVTEAIVAALVVESRSRLSPIKEHHVALKRLLVHLARLTALCYGLPDANLVGGTRRFGTAVGIGVWDPKANTRYSTLERLSSRSWHHELDLRAAEVNDQLFRQCEDIPLELCQKIGIPQAHGLPQLAGGQLSILEQRYRKFVKRISGMRTTVEKDADTKTFTCRPISKREALDRGTLGGDCSSHAVPLRALLPHYVYYGVFDGNEQKRGYMTVFEAWAKQPDGSQIPVLCLETINVPLPPFASVQQDLLALFEAIARSRGLHTKLALSLKGATWNYSNARVLERSRRFRQGTKVRLSPADPACWKGYTRATRESGYHPFTANTCFARADVRLLASFNERVDLVQPENLAEAHRLASLPPKKLKPTLRSNGKVTGFISEWPTVK